MNTIRCSQRNTDKHIDNFLQKMGWKLHTVHSMSLFWWKWAEFVWLGVHPTEIIRFLYTFSLTWRYCATNYKFMSLLKWQKASSFGTCQFQLKQVWEGGWWCCSSTQSNLLPKFDKYAHFFCDWMILCDFNYFPLQGTTFLGADMSGCVWLLHTTISSGLSWPQLSAAHLSPETLFHIDELLLPIKWTLWDANGQFWF